MTLKVRNPASGRRQGFAGEMVSDAVLDREYSPAPFLRQEHFVDPVAVLAARSRVAPATIRAQLAAWCIRGAV